MKLFFVLIQLSFVALVSAEELRLCTQNLSRFGAKDSYDRSKEIWRASRFAQVFAAAGCELIALQEIWNSSPLRSLEQLGELLRLALEQESGVPFRFATENSSSTSLSLGFLWNKDRFHQIKVEALGDPLLPILSAFQRPRRFLRVPLIFRGKIRSDSIRDTSIVIMNFHFKSQRHFPPDPAGLRWEGYRMEMAAALHANAMAEIEEDTDLLVLLGDRNSNPDSASAAILEGRLFLSDFQQRPGCAVLEDTSPSCESVSERSALFQSAFLKDRGADTFGSYLYRKEWNWLDEVLYWRAKNLSQIPPTSLVIPQRIEVSDHQLLVSEFDLTPSDQTFSAFE